MLETVMTDVKKCRPHVVILGAGASVAAFPNGDANGKRLPLMNNLIETLELQDILERTHLECESTNFEEIYSELYSRGEYSEILEELNERVYDYFGSLRIPDYPTIYDYLLLSLRNKDAIATFNWDPLLAQAYARCCGSTKNLPRLTFLHGNVGIGFCDRCYGVLTPLPFPCPRCGSELKRMCLLYPVKEKDYEKDEVIQQQWNNIQRILRDAFIVTIFGYSAPKSDVRAKQLFKEAWGDVEERSVEHFEIIDIMNEEELRETWSDFIYEDHYEVRKTYFDSWIARFPRRSVEANIGLFFECRPIIEHKIPEGVSFEEVCNSIQELLKYEMN